MLILVRPTIQQNGPMARYDALVRSGRLREDSHQKGKSLRYSSGLILAVVGVLEKLYQDLIHYKPAEILSPKPQQASGSPVFTVKRISDPSYWVGLISVHGAKSRNIFLK